MHIFRPEMHNSDLKCKIRLIIYRFRNFHHETLSASLRCLFPMLFVLLFYIVENRIEEVQDLFNLFVQRKIKFFSLYYFIKKYDLEEEVLKSRIFSTVYMDIKTLMSFLNLKEISEV